MFGVRGITSARNLLALVLGGRIYRVLKSKKWDHHIALSIAVKTFAPGPLLVIRIGFAVQLRGAMKAAERNCRRTFQFGNIPFHRSAISLLALTAAIPSTTLE